MQRTPQDLRGFYLIAIKKESVSDGLDDDGNSQRSAEVNAFASVQQQLWDGPSTKKLVAEDEAGDTPTNDDDDNDDNENDQFDNDEFDIKLGQIRQGNPQFRAFLQSSRATRNLSPCKQCAAFGLQCDRQRPSCWKCQRYQLPCYYNDDEEREYRPGEDAADSDTESISWQDSVKANPYQNLEGKQKLYKLPVGLRGTRRGRLSKPFRPDHKALWEREEDEYIGEALLGNILPTFSDSDSDVESQYSSVVESEFAYRVRPRSPKKSDVILEPSGNSSTSQNTLIVREPFAIELRDAPRNTSAAESIVNRFSQPTSPAETLNTITSQSFSATASIVEDNESSGPSEAFILDEAFGNALQEPGVFSIGNLVDLSDPLPSSELENELLNGFLTAPELDFADWLDPTSETVVDSDLRATLTASEYNLAYPLPTSDVEESSTTTPAASKHDVAYSPGLSVSTKKQQIIEAHSTAYEASLVPLPDSPSAASIDGYFAATPEALEASLMHHSNLSVTLEVEISLEATPTPSEPELIYAPDLLTATSTEEQPVKASTPIEGMLLDFSDLPNTLEVRDDLNISPAISEYSIDLAGIDFGNILRTPSAGSDFRIVQEDSASTTSAVLEQKLPIGPPLTSIDTHREASIATLPPSERNFTLSPDSPSTNELYEAPALSASQYSLALSPEPSAPLTPLNLDSILSSSRNSIASSLDISKEKEKESEEQSSFDFDHLPEPPTTKSSYAASSVASPSHLSLEICPEPPLADVERTILPSMVQEIPPFRSNRATLKIDLEYPEDESAYYPEPPMTKPLYEASSAASTSRQSLDYCPEVPTLGDGGLDDLQRGPVRYLESPTQTEGPTNISSSIASGPAFTYSPASSGTGVQATHPAFTSTSRHNQSVYPKLSGNLDRPPRSASSAVSGFTFADCPEALMPFEIDQVSRATSPTASGIIIVTPAPPLSTKRSSQLHSAPSIGSESDHIHPPDPPPHTFRNYISSSSIGSQFSLACAPDPPTKFASRVDSIFRSDSPTVPGFALIHCPAPPSHSVTNENHMSPRSMSSSSSKYTASIASTEIGIPPSGPAEAMATPPTTGGSSLWLPETEKPSQDDTLKSFQCTFCLETCKDQGNWQWHELQHVPTQTWTCMPFGPVEKAGRRGFCVFCGGQCPRNRHCDKHNIEECFNDTRKERSFVTKDAFEQHLKIVHRQKGIAPNMEDWSRDLNDDDFFWNCGFCDAILPTWTKRVSHIGDHFNEGSVMSSWDPLSPPYPLDKTTMNCAAWFPQLPWDARTIWDLEHERGPLPKSREEEDEDEEWNCKNCDIEFRNEDEVERHKDIWHEWRETWFCPQVEEIEQGILSRYFFPTYRQDEPSDDDVCPFCNRHFIEIMEAHPEMDDTWDIRYAHLMQDHNFDSCEKGCKSISASGMLLHLANVHALCLNDLTSKVLESCRKDERPLAKKMNRGGRTKRMDDED